MQSQRGTENLSAQRHSEIFESSLSDLQSNCKIFTFLTHPNLYGNTFYSLVSQDLFNLISKKNKIIIAMEYERSTCRLLGPGQVYRTEKDF